MRSCPGIAAFAVLVVLAGWPPEAGGGSAAAASERLLVLPIRFTQFKYGPNSFPEFIPDKSGVAERNLEGSMDRAQKREDTTQLVDLPELSADEQAVVREHIDLLRLAAIGVFTDLASGGAPWREKEPWRLDYSIGNGLAFLAERTGVDRAIFVSGARAEPSGGVAIVTLVNMLLFQGFLVAPGNQKELSAVLVDLRSGDVLAAYLPERGFAGEADDVAGANTWMHALFDSIPQTLRDQFSSTGPPRAGKQVRTPRPRRGFVVQRPPGWRLADSLHLLCFYRHSLALESICIDDESLDDELKEKGVKPDADPIQLGLNAVDVLKKDPRFADMTMGTLERATVAGREGFRVELTSRFSFGGARLRERHVVYGVKGTDRTYLLRYDAPTIYYFDRHLAEFEATIATLKLM